jgi:hypothetical protein
MPYKISEQWLTPPWQRSHGTVHTTVTESCFHEKSHFLHPDAVHILFYPRLWNLRSKEARISFQKSRKGQNPNIFQNEEGAKVT